jgi:TolB-like protein
MRLIRNLRYMILLAALLTALACATTGQDAAAKRTIRSIPRNQRTVMMVLNFKNSSVKDAASTYQPWEIGIASMVMTDLESIGVFNVLSKERLRDILDQQAFQLTGAVDEKTAVEVGKLAAAQYLLAGSFMVVNSELYIEATVFSIEKGVALGASSVRGRFDSFFDLEKQLVVELTSYLGVLLNADEQVWFTAQIETRSADASLDNYSGEMAVLKAKELRAKGRSDLAAKLIEEARAKFERALKIDPAYERAKRNLSSLTMAMPMTL